MFADSINTLTC